MFECVAIFGTGQGAFVKKKLDGAHTPPPLPFSLVHEELEGQFVLAIKISLMRVLHNNSKMT